MPIRIRFLAIAALTAVSLLWALALVTARAGAEPSAVPLDPQNTLTRQRDPVVVQGSSLPAFGGAPLDELFAYAYNSGTWQQIPFQFDEVEPIGNTYVVTEDGLLDANDELAFMALDAGQQALGGAWIDDALSTGFPRYELRVSTPCIRASGPGSIFTALPPWRLVLALAICPCLPTRSLPFYSATVNFSQTLGLTGLTLNGHGVDIVDQSHVSVEAP